MPNQIGKMSYQKEDLKGQMSCYMTVWKKSYFQHCIDKKLDSFQKANLFSGENNGTAVLFVFFSPF